MVTIQVPAIRALVALGCSVAVTDSVLSTPIHVAAGEGHIEAVLALRELVICCPGSWQCWETTALTPQAPGIMSTAGSAMAGQVMSACIEQRG